MSSRHHINEELLTEILKRLPPKTLLKFTSISKSFHSLITNPSFISIHTKHTIKSTTNSPKSLLRHYSWPHKQEHYSIHGKNTSFNLLFPFKSYSQFFQIIGSYNGLICLSDTYRVNSHTIILWNPSIRKFITLPPPTITLDQIYMFVFGFGFDFNVKVNDYKVVRVVYSMNKRINQVKIVPEVEVYQLRLDSWRRITLKSHPHPHYIISELSLQAYLNGAVHWIGYNPSEVNEFRDLSMVLFDMSREVFEEMALPESICGLSVLDLSVFSSRNLLSLMQYNRDSGSQWIQYGSCSIWMMKEYGDVDSWSKFFAIDMRGVGRGLGVRSDGEALVVMRSGDLGSYDVESGEVSELGIKGIVNSFHMEDYVETLSLLDCFNGSY